MRVIRLLNPLVRALLRSRLHPLLSGRLMLLAYHGPRSGRRFEIPLRYLELGDRRLAAVAVGPERKLWWRAFRDPTEASLVVRGSTLAATGVLKEASERTSVLARYNGGSARLERLTRDAAVVVFTPSR